MAPQGWIALGRANIARTMRTGPRWIRITVGAAAVVAGALVIARPATSLGLLAVLIGIGAILEGLLALWEGEVAWKWRITAASAWTVVGAAVLLSPGLTLWSLVWVVGGGLMLVGLVRIIAAFRGSRTLDQRLVTGAFGVAAIAFGGVALVWRDVSMIVVAIAFGAWLILTGATTVWGAVRRPRPTQPPKSAGIARRFVNGIAAIAAVSVAIAAVGVTIAVTRDDAVTDPFYAAPREVPEQPGRLIRAEAFERGVPPGAKGWRILYTTTHDDGSPAVASALVVTPDAPGFHRVVSWAHGTTGTAPTCAPSLQEEPFKSGGMFALALLVAEGYAVVATDYVGLGATGPHAYLVGRESAQAVLDATRAARQLRAANLARQTVLWGHSQGGQAVLWASQIAADYAPELAIVGTAAFSPVDDLPALVSTIPYIRGGSVMASFVVNAYAAVYADVRTGDYVRVGSEVAVAEFSKRCLESPGTYASILSVAAMSADPNIFATDPRIGPLGARLRENIPKPDGPLLVVQGRTDPLIDPRIQTAWVKHACSTSDAVIDYRMLPKDDHVSMLYSISPFIRPLFDWTADRFALKPPTSTCGD